MIWLLLRGFGRECRHWGTFPWVLSAKTRAERAFCLDLPGVGSEASRAAPLSIADTTDELRDRWLRLGATQGAPRMRCLLGVSMGGMIALDWSQRYPLDFDHTVIINSSAGGLSPLRDRIRAEALWEILCLAVVRNRFERERRILELNTNLLSPETLEATIAAWAKISEENPIRLATSIRQLLAAARFRLEEKLRTPVLILNSEEDQFVNPDCSRQLAEHLQAPIFTHPTAGHELPLDDPEWVIERISDWLGSAAT